MIDFELKRSDQVRGGLIIEFSLRAYQPKTSLSFRHPTSVFITEGAFGFLEASVRKHCPEYNHYGPTEVTSGQWMPILVDWATMASDLSSAWSAAAFLWPRSFYDFEEDAESFARNFRLYKPRLLKLITHLSNWLRAALANHPSVSIFGP